MALDDVIKGFAVMNQGLTDLAVSTAAKDAQTKLEDLTRQTDLDTNARAQKQADVGHQLMLRLQAAGAPADQIAATAARFAPSASDLAQLQAAKELEMMKEKHTKEMQKEHMQTLIHIQELKNAGMGGKAAEAEKKMVNGFSKEFAQQNKEQIGAVTKYQDALKLIDATGGNAVGSGLVKMGFIKAAAGRVNEREFLAADESQGEMQKLAKKFNIALTGSDPASVRQFWKKLAGKMADNALDDLDLKAAGFAQGKVDMDLTTEEMGAKIAAGLRSQFVNPHRSAKKSAAPAPDTSSTGTAPAQPPSALKYISP